MVEETALHALLPVAASITVSVIAALVPVTFKTFKTFLASCLYIYIIVEKMVFNMALGNCRHVFRPDFGPHHYSVNQL